MFESIERLSVIVELVLQSGEAQQCEIDLQQLGADIAEQSAALDRLLHRSAKPKLSILVVVSEGTQRFLNLSSAYLRRLAGEVSSVVADDLPEGAARLVFRRLDPQP